MRIVCLKGAVVGLLTGLVVALLLGFGGPKPTTPSLPRSTAGCSVNYTVYTEASVLTALTSVASTSNQ